MKHASRCRCCISTCESFGTIIEWLQRFGGTVARIEGKIFKTMKEAEVHGFELAREREGSKRRRVTCMAIFSRLFY